MPSDSSQGIATKPVSPSLSVRKLDAKVLEDFPGSVYVPSPDGHDNNVLIMFHGLGDAPDNFCKLAKKMALPQTAALCLQAPTDLPMDLGGCWFSCNFAPDDLPYVPESQSRAELQELRRLLFKLFDKLCEAHHWPHWSRFVLFGFSQGATVALDAMLHAPYRFGAVIAVSPSFVDFAVECTPQNGAKQTQCLWTAGSKDPVVAVAHAQRQFDKMCHAVGSRDNLQMNVFPKGHDMVSSPEEMYQVMQVLSKNLYLVDPAIAQMKDVVEVVQK